MGCPLAWANLLFERGDTEAAIERYRQVLRLDPRSAVTHLELGTLLEERGDRDRAFVHYETALRLHPDLRRAQRRLDRLRPRGAGAG